MNTVYVEFAGTTPIPWEIGDRAISIYGYMSDVDVALSTDPALSSQQFSHLVTADLLRTDFLMWLGGNWAVGGLNCIIPEKTTIFLLSAGGAGAGRISIYFNYLDQLALTG